MNDQQPALHTVPTELGRSDGFLDIAALGLTILIVWQLALYNVSLWLMIPFVLVVAIFTLTGEPAADVPYLGAVAAGLRSKLGLRRAHEWILAFWHYFRLAIWPVWRAHCIRLWKSARRRTSECRAQLNAAIRSSRLRASSWVSATRFKLSAKLPK